MATFYTILTDIGQAKIANAIALGQTIEITHLAVGDGNGSSPTPDSSAEALVNEVRRAPINTSNVDGDNPSWIVVEQVLPPDVGGWTIREIGIFDIDGDLVGVGNYPETYKPVLAEGSSRTQTVRFVLEVSDTSAVTLKVDPSVVLATREYVDQERAEHEASRSHPLATTTERGMVEKATTSEAKGGAADKFPDAAGLQSALKVFGLGLSHGDNPELSIDGGDFNDTSLLMGGVYYWNTSIPANAPPGMGKYGEVVPTAGYSSGSSNRTDLAWSRQDGRIWWRPWTSGSPNGWVELFHSGSLIQATEAILGLVRWATPSEHTAGSSSTRAVHPAGMKATIDDRIADQSTVDNGSNDAKFVTPKKLKAWATQWVKQATETVAGMLKIATQTQVGDGTDDATAVTPKKLKWGFSVSLQTNGYVALPFWLGGIIFQWVKPQIAGADNVITLPTTFPSGLLGGATSDHGAPERLVAFESNLTGPVSEVVMSTDSSTTYHVYGFFVGH